jgi:MSHA biogenesis protein MshQ
MTKLYPLVRLTDPYGKRLNDLDQNANMLSNSEDSDSKSLIDSEPLEMRFGRLVVGNNYGTEFEPLQIPLKAEYWDGTSFGVNTSDSCSEYSKSKLNIRNMLEGQDIIGEVGTFSYGYYVGDPYLQLKAPNEPSTFQVIYDAPSWLQYDWNGDDNYDNNPSGELRFGSYRGNDRVIYWREN